MSSQNGLAADHSAMETLLILAIMVAVGAFWALHE
jgi:hypothetical protein